MLRAHAGAVGPDSDEEGAEEFQAVDATDSGFDRTFWVRHHTHDIASAIGYAGNVVNRSIDVRGAVNIAGRCGVPGDDLAKPLERRQTSFVDGVGTVAMSDGQAKRRDISERLCPAS